MIGRIRKKITVKNCDVNDIKDVGVILDYVHDRFFAIEKVVIDQERQQLTIPISIICIGSRVSGKILWLERRTHLIKSAAILIHNVVSYELVDEAGVGQGDINTILFDGENVIIECGLPVTINIKVSNLHLELEITDNIVGEKTYFSWTKLSETAGSSPLS